MQYVQNTTCALTNAKILGKRDSGFKQVVSFRIAVDEFTSTNHGDLVRAKSSALMYFIVCTGPRLATASSHHGLLTAGDFQSYTIAVLFIFDEHKIADESMFRPQRLLK